MLPLHRHIFSRVPKFHSRCLASVADTVAPAPYQIFDRYAKVLQKDMSAVPSRVENSRTVDYLRNEVADRLIERILDIKRKFNTVLDLGSGPGHFAKLLETETTQKVVMFDSSRNLLYRDPDEEFEVEVERIVGDEENLLAVIPRNSQEAVVSCLSLHWVNDLPGALTQIREALVPDGVFLGAMFGGDTLFELRTSLQLAEIEREGGISPHVSPMTDTRDVSNLLGRAGFTLLTVDIDEVTVNYPSMWELMEDLQAMGENNAILGRRGYFHRDTLAAASAIYKEMHGKEDGSVPATFQIIYMIGWKPSPNQPKPLERGSATKSLKDVL